MAVEATATRGHYFFLGIGGIGMSALARYFHQSGHKVSGYDRDITALTKKLEASGIEVQYQFDSTKLSEAIDIVIYTPAIKPDQLEFQYFEKRGIEMLKRSQALQRVLSDKKVIAVAGTHGKTTTCALLAHILHYNSFGATAFVGGVMSNYGTNFLYGEGPWVIVEADEYDRSFWRLHPEIAMIQAMDADHLDIYGTEAKMIDAYCVFTSQIARGGRLFLSTEAGDKMSGEWREALAAQGVSCNDFGIDSGDVNTIDLYEADGVSRFYLESQGPQFELALGGLHNVQNTLGAISVARALGIADEDIAEALAVFTGIERRFEYVLRSEDVIIIDDYAHHPKEIDAAISAVRNNHPGRRLSVVFQPHLYTRTRDFMQDFADALGEADDVILVELYPAREEPIEGVDSEVLLSKVKLENKAFVPKRELVQYLESNKKELILLLGAGDVYKLIDKIKLAYS